MNKTQLKSTTLLSAAIAALAGSAGIANATEPCNHFGECKVLVEINSSDGDIGFHFLMDGDDLIAAALKDPDGNKIFKYRTAPPLRDQYLTETFAESAEPLCFDPTEDDDDENDDEDFVTLGEFLDRWTDGTYHFIGIGDEYEILHGYSDLSFNLPAAPAEVEYEEEKDGGDVEGEISWEPGNDLGECADYEELADLVADGDLPMHPENVTVAAWEVVLEPDVEDGDPLGAMTYVVRIPGDADELEVEVPDDYLEALPDNTPAKVEVGAIGVDDNATFTEIDEICLNKKGKDGCGFDEEED